MNFNVDSINIVKLFVLWLFLICNLKEMENKCLIIKLDKNIINI